jgi:hypothetical protein
MDLGVDAFGPPAHDPRRYIQEVDMGVSAAPRTIELIESLDRLMQAPLSARNYHETLSPLINDDSTFDNIDLAARKNPDVDIRPIIAATLEEWSRWMSPKAWSVRWEEGVRERAAEIAARFSDADFAGLFPEPMNPDTPLGAAEIVANILGYDPDYPFSNFRVARIMPGIYGVVDPDEEKLFRVETARELVYEAPEELADDLKAELFGVERALRH